MGNNASAGTSRYLTGCPPIPPQPSEGDVLHEFEELLRGKHVTMMVVEEMGAFEPTETKWMYISLNKFLATPEIAEKEWLEAHTCAHEIHEVEHRQEHHHELFRAIRINMTLRSREWIDKFIAVNGVDALSTLLDSSKKLPVAVHMEVVNTLFTLSNLNNGIVAIVQSSECCHRFVNTFSSSTNHALSVRVLKLLGVICCHSQVSQLAVISAFGASAPSGSSSRFSSIATMFKEQTSEPELQMAILTFINIVLNTTVVVGERVAIRDDLEKDGFVTELDKYRTPSDGAAPVSASMTMQLQIFQKSQQNDRAKASLTLELPTIDTSIDVAPRRESATSEAALSPSGAAQGSLSKDPARSLQARKSLKLNLSEAHTDVDAEPVPPAPSAGSSVSRRHSGQRLKLDLTDTNTDAEPVPPAPSAGSSLSRRPSGQLLPSLSIPSVEVAFEAPVSKTKPSIEIVSQPVAETTTQPVVPSFESILAKLQEGTQRLDAGTNQKLLQLLTTLATTLTTEAADGVKVVEQLERSLVEPAAQSDEAPSVIGKMNFRLLPTDGDSYANSLATPAKPTFGRAVGQLRLFGDSTLDHATSSTSHSPVNDAATRSPVHSQYEEESSPRRSMTETESCDESSHEYEDTTSRKTSGAKLALAGFFQHLKKGQALPTTPAPTPMATASVKKDAKRPVFPSFGTASAAPSPMPPSHANPHSFSLPPLTPLRPSLSLPPLTPVRPAMTPSKPHFSSILSPTPHAEHLESVKEEETESRSPHVSISLPVPPPPATPSSSGPDISKFRKLLAMGAPKAAVRAKMQQAGVDPDLLDHAPSEAPLPPPAPASAVPADAPAAPSGGPDVSKFRKLLTMGAPLEAVKAKMRQAGLDPALLDQKPASTPSAVQQPAQAEVPPVPTPTQESAPDEAERFRKLLAMGAPLEAVKAKMRQAGLDPVLLDRKSVSQPSATTSSTPSTPEPAAAPSVPASRKVKDDPEYVKFFKLQAMGAPAAAVKAKMTQAGLNPALLDTPDADMPGKSPSQPPAQAPAPVAAKVLVKDDPEYAKFFKLRAMGAPAEAVKAKMRQAGVNPDFLDTPDAEMPSKAEPQTASAPVQAKVLVKDDSEYAKFFKLQAMGAPAPAVKAKMVQAGLHPDLLDTPNAEMPSKGGEASGGASAPEAPKVLVKDDPEYAKFFKLQAMGAPAPAVKAKMVQAGLNPDLLDTPDAPVPSKGGESAIAPPPAPANMNAASALCNIFAKRQGNSSAGNNQAAESGPVVLAKDHPEYAKFFKLVTMGAPADTVKGKMLMAGLRPELLDTPDAPVPPAGAASNNQSSNNAASGPLSIPAPARRANLSLSIKPAVAKPTTRPFYWQHLKGEAIQGTIWEEIDKERSQGNNETPLPLSDSELALLENEFPAQTAPMTGPAKGRSFSMDSVGKEAPASPKVVFLIDRSRANNVSIIIKQFRMSHAALREAIMKVDAQVLTLERVQGLLKIVPTDEEVTAIMGFQGDILTLNEAERVLKELISVPRLKQRLAALQSKLQFPTFARDLQSKIEKLQSASTEIAQSAEFKTILLVVLQVGNKMNQGTARGGAKGFRLGDLIKLAQLKSSDKVSTLLHYVARMMRQKNGNTIRLSDSLGSLYDVQNIPIPELPADMSKISEIVDYITNEIGAQKLKNAIEDKEPCDHFVAVMTEFMESASQAQKTLKQDLDKLFQSLKDTMDKFGFGDGSGDSDPAEPATQGAGNIQATLQSACEFFATIYEFSNALAKADRENEVKRLREEAKARQSQKAKNAPLRSMSSRDIRANLAKPVEKKKESEEGAGPETPESSKSGARVSPLLRQRSASLSSIVENNTIICPDGALIKPPSHTVIAPVKSPSTNKPQTQSSSASIEKKTAGEKDREATLKEKTLTPTKKAEASPTGPETKEKKTSPLPTGIKPPTKFLKDKDKDANQDKDKLKLKLNPKPMLMVPGKIVKSTTKPVSESPNKDLPPPTPRKPTTFCAAEALSSSAIANQKVESPAVEDDSPFLAFDTASIEEIRSQLAMKHSSGPASTAKPSGSAQKEAIRGNNNASSSPPKTTENPATSCESESAPTTSAMV
ncbi:hypothetical protein Poli38472_002347 [Pythium oligandrum]|uniref:Formin-like protein n=1 Tax=Pythium oligandrum TaxID=41045 RepID=A0A8K1FI41_PYTOL|nr:hypothetical protein Poli38472_002347 [Pythium oligandrum]|eukprot:TMW63406.1 hypothetical protein Poli38472_002347 [Pythium oligandrum]